MRIARSRVANAVGGVGGPRVCHWRRTVEARTQTNVLIETSVRTWSRARTPEEESRGPSPELGAST